MSGKRLLTITAALALLAWGVSLAPRPLEATYTPSIYAQAPQCSTISLVDPATSGTATITSVNTTYTALVLSGMKNIGAGGTLDGLVRIVLTNATTVTATRETGTGDMTVSFCTLPFNAQFISTGGVQAISIVIAGGTSSNTQTVTSVGSKAVFFPGGWTYTAGTEVSFAKFPPSIVKTNATTYTATRGSSDATATTTIKGFVVDFK